MTHAQPWWKPAVFYQIYPRSFADSNGDGIGDLPGITERIDYLKELGIDAIWLSPFYRSPMIDFGYDVSDHCDVDPCFGTLADFDELLAAAHARNIRLIIDFVPNHTSDQHHWFLESSASRRSPKRDWYLWADPADDGGPPNNWLSCFERVGPAWTLHDATGQYYLHSYTPQQPDLNWRNPAVHQEMEQVLRFWLERGVDGFRIDVPHRLVKDRALEDNPPEIAHLRRAFGRPAPAFRSMNQPEVHDVLRSFRAVLDSYPDRMTVGEVGLTDPRQIARYYGQSDELDLVFNFEFWQQPWSARAFALVVEETEATLPEDAWPDYSLSNHDTTRAASRYNGPELGPLRMRLAALMLLTLRGTPFLYYGEEIGMTDVELDTEWASDPAGRDSARTPMQWEPTEHAGFTTGQPWLPVPTSARTTNVATQLADADSLLNLYRRLIGLRRKSQALRLGSYQTWFVDDVLFSFTRESTDERLLIALNFGKEPATCPLGSLEGECVLSTARRVESGERVQSELMLSGNEGAIVRVG